MSPTVLSFCLISILFGGYCRLFVHIATCDVSIPGGSFRRMTNVRDRASYSTSYNARSAIECNAACKRDPKCKTFSYDKSSKLCHVGNRAKNPVFVETGEMVCPQDKSYILWLFPDMTLCLRTVLEKKPHLTALDSCKKDGGHLILIESGQVRAHVNDILDELNYNGDVYFDGYKPGHTNVFISWKKQALPWTVWGGGNPHNRVGEDCFGGKSVDDYMLRDLFCNINRAFICQIDTK